MGFNYSSSNVCCVVEYTVVSVSAVLVSYHSSDNISAFPFPFTSFIDT